MRNPSLVNAYEVEASIGVIAGNTVSSMPERLECEVLQKGRYINTLTCTFTFTAARCSWCACVVHLKVKVTSSLTDVWQQLLEQQDSTLIVHMHHLFSPLAAWKPHQCTSAWIHRLTPKRRNMFVRNQRGMSMSWNGIWLKYGQQPAELHWSIDRSVTRLFYCVSQSKHFEHLLWCVSLWYVTVITFKAYTTVVMNKLTYVSFHEVGWEHPSGEVVNFDAVLLRIY